VLLHILLHIVAVNYAMTRQFPKPELHIFYDMGAGSTVASLVKFSTTGRRVNIEVKHVGYDPHLGGHDMDALLVNRMVAWFNKKYPNVKEPITSNARAMANLYKEAARVKIILSVNNQASAGVEAIHADKDLRFTITRAEFESDLEPLLARMASPLDSVLVAAGGVEKVNSLILVGGSVRVPLVQKTLETIMGGPELIAKNVNGDEASVLGAAFYAAGMSVDFRVREIKIADGLPFSIQINGSDLFPAHSLSLGHSKSVTLKKGNPLKLDISQVVKDQVVRFGAVTTNGSATHVEQKITFQVDNSGGLRVSNATGVNQLSSGILGLSVTNETASLQVEWDHAFAHMNEKEFEAARNRISSWKTRESARLKRESVRNLLETLVYEVRDKVDDSNLKKLISSEELSAVENAANEVGTWLDEHDGELGDLEIKHASLKAKFSDVTERLNEFRQNIAMIRAHNAELGKNSTFADDYLEKELWNLDEVRTEEKGLKVLVDELRAKKEKERKEKEEKELAERLAREKVMKELMEKMEKEKAEKEAKEKAKKEAKEAKEKSELKTNNGTDATGGKVGNADESEVKTESDISDQGKAEPGDDNTLTNLPPSEGDDSASNDAQTTSTDGSSTITTDLPEYSPTAWTEDEKTNTKTKDEL
jgi:hypoxia up-regulated 1